MDQKFYVYGHYKPHEMAPFYIGKESKRRAWDKNERSKHSEETKEKIRNARLSYLQRFILGEK